MNARINVNMTQVNFNNGCTLPKQATLPLSELQTTHFQRDLNMSVINEIKSGYDPNRLDPIKVSYRNGKYYIIDGQHRYVALSEMFGLTTIVNVTILYGLTYEQEAEYFVTQNKNKTDVSQPHKLRGEIVYDAKARDMVSVCKAAGFVLSTGRGKAKNKINAVGTFKKIYNNLGSPNTFDMLSLIKQNWDGDSEAVRSTFLEGMADFYSLYGNQISAKRFNKVFGGVKAIDIITVVNKNPSKTWTKPRKMTMEMVAMYNKGIQKKLPEDILYRSE